MPPKSYEPCGGDIIYEKFPLMVGLCVKCSFDLRGSVERCPECGSEFESSGFEELGSSADEANG